MPELMKIYADKDSPRANGEGWHSDVSCDPQPPMGTILYIKQCPPKGGDTLFASMYAAYEALSDRMKAYLEGLTAMHDGEHVYRGLFANFGQADKPTYPRAEHPVVRTHPVTGKKALYVNARVRQFVGLSRMESQPLIKFLCEQSVSPRFVYRHYWNVGDLVMWDNRCLVHLAVGDYDPAEIRHMIRTSTMGDHHGRFEQPESASAETQPGAIPPGIAASVAALHD